MKSFKELREKLDNRQVNENIFWVQVGQGRDSLTVKTRADNKKEALAKIKKEYPGSKVKLDPTQKQDIEEASQFMITVPKGGPGGKDLNMKVKGKDKNDAVKQWRKMHKKYKDDEVVVKEL